MLIIEYLCKKKTTTIITTFFFFFKFTINYESKNKMFFFYFTVLRQINKAKLYVFCLADIQST